jgi:hypothetical protein
MHSGAWLIYRVVTLLCKCIPAWLTHLTIYTWDVHGNDELMSLVENMVARVEVIVAERVEHRRRVVRTYRAHRGDCSPGIKARVVLLDGVEPGAAVMTAQRVDDARRGLGRGLGDNNGLARHHQVRDPAVRRAASNDSGAQRTDQTDLLRDLPLAHLGCRSHGHMHMHGRSRSAFLHAHSPAMMEASMVMRRAGLAMKAGAF